MNYCKKYLLWLFLLLVYQGVTAQNRAPFERLTLLENNPVLIDFVGYQPQVIKKSNSSTKFLGTKPNFTLEYTPDSGYVGQDTLIVEYKDSEDWFRSKIEYLSFVIEVRESIVLAERDYYTMNQGDTLLADVLDNDSTTVGALTLKSVPISMSGAATVVNNEVQFIPESGFSGIARFQYQTCDSIGTCDFAYVTILVKGGSFNSDTVHVALNENTSLAMSLPEENFSIIDSARNGQLALNPAFILEYTPDSDFDGRDSFLLEDAAGETRLYRAHVLDLKDQRKSLVDDIVYTEINQEVWIDVQANDVTDNFKVKTVKQPGQGSLFYVDSVDLYKFVPPLNKESIESFEYGLKGGKIDEKATATIYINDGHPDVTGTYQFTTNVNEKLVIRYDLPIDGHEFKLKSPPVIGKVDIFNQDTTVEVKCDSVSGSHFLVFTPGDSYLGPHSFTLEHCVSGTSFCVDVDIVVTTVLPRASGCYCTDDCVWSGDINYDGRVDMRDLLPLAHHLGLSGQSRKDGDVSWDAQSANKWNQNINGTHVDLKHADTDGDGSLLASDTLGISENYHREHSMVPQLVGPSRSYAWYLEPRFDTVKAGELAVIDVVFGNNQYPIEDMEGVAYTVNFSPHVKYDSASVHVTHHPTSFLTDNSPFLGMWKQPQYRQIDVGQVRTSGTEASGFGVINTLEIIVEDDLAGFKSTSGIVPFQIHLNNATGISTTGETFSLPETIVTMYVDYGERKLPFGPDRVTVWPNPSQGVFNVHLNGNEKMTSASLFAADGRLIKSWSGIDPDRQRFVVSPELRGVFLLQVETTAGVVTKKIQLLGQ